MVGISLGGGGGESYIQGAIIFGALTIFLMPLMIGIFAPTETIAPNELASEEIRDEVLQSYLNFTGSARKEQPWALTGIYTPYTGGKYNYTPDGWLYGELIPSYTPTQYRNDAERTHTVVKGMDGIQNNPPDCAIYTYRVGSYNNNNVWVPDNTTKTYDGHHNGDVYTYVTMDVGQKSDIFFTEQLKRTSGQYFYYEYTGYRYSFQALQDGYTVSYVDGKSVVTKVSATSSSLSLIWYDFASQSGISGQLIISGSDKGVAQITAEDIIKAFNSATNTARFELNFNGVPMAIYIRMDPSMTSQGVSIEECYNKGYWSVMVASYTTNAVDQTAASSPFSPDKMWNTAIDLLTFNLDDYSLSPTMSIVASLTFDLILLAMILAIGINHPAVLIIASVAALIIAAQDFIDQVIIFFQNIVDFFADAFGGVDWPEIDWWPPW